MASGSFTPPRARHWFSFNDCSDVSNFFTVPEACITADKFLTNKFIARSRFGISAA